MADAPGSLSEKPPCPHLRLSPDAAGPALDRRRLTFSCPWGLKPKDPSPTGWRGGSCTSRAWLPGMWHEALGCHSGEGLPSHRLFPCPVLGLAGNLGLNTRRATELFYPIVGVALAGTMASLSPLAVAFAC